MILKNKIQILSVVFVFLLLSCSGQEKIKESKINGVSFVASREAVTSKHIDPVKKVQSNYVALMPFGFIRDLSTPKIIHNTNRQWFGETKNGLLQYAEKFHKVGIKVMVKPQIWIRNGEYTGTIEADSEEKWGVLEESYSTFILTYAEAAQKVNADILCIGTELEKFVANRPEYWKELIRNIKKVYKGKLTYAANWDEFKRVTFWEQLDFIGVDAYFPLSDKKTPSVEDFELGWKLHKEEITKIQQQFNKPVLFTEFGYRSIDFNGKKPWEANRVEGSVNLEAQANGLQAIYNQFWKEDWFAGGFVWKWFHKHDGVGGDKNNRFTPQNKPAEILLQKLFKLQ
ncbi:glycoside hydrolase [Polaribacter sp. MSW13]|uniref:Glycoside hydrolase n=1 Tax=Polaribacter marinus TaxID=2916838 RepID=A0A9X1VMG9_9FLAO|nr:glycoside hydrolase [Polaribacter marinus]MCI2228827.1 glycoside hydrolase [Polaribacter marinus]